VVIGGVLGQTRYRRRCDHDAARQAPVTPRPQLGQRAHDDPEGASSLFTWRSWQTLVLAHAPADRGSGDSDTYEDGCKDYHPNARSTMAKRPHRQ
jgi:hypothetical protein